MHRILLIVLAAGLLSGCATLPAADGRPTLAMTPTQPGEATFRLSGGPLQNAVLTGDARADGGGWILTVRELRWFNNWANGWTEASFLLEAAAKFQPSGAGGTLTADAPALDAPGAATIRYFDAYVRGDKGITEFSRRWARIQAVCDELRSKAVPQNKLASYLFPEVYGYDSPNEGKATIPALGIDWNTAYTKDKLSEALRPLRDSGTLYRDYQESPGLWALAWNWKALWAAPVEVALLWKKS